MASYDNKVLTGDQLVYFSSLVKTALASKANSSALSGKQDALTIGGSGNPYNASTNPVATIGDIPDGVSGYLVDNPINTAEVIYDDSDENNVIWLADKIVAMDSDISTKQDALVFNTAYNSSSNKVATMSDITTALSGISSFSFEIVQSLPQSNISTSKIYLVAKSTSGTNQVYTEYAYVNNAWEIIGDTAMTIDTLSNAEVQTIWNSASAS